jgi:hypothetical protein
MINKDFIETINKIWFKFKVTQVFNHKNNNSVNNEEIKIFSKLEEKKTNKNFLNKL